MTIIPICIDCKYFNTEEIEGFSCKAFPNGIPKKILQGIIDHKKEHYKGDNGLLFKKYSATDSV